MKDVASGAVSEFSRPFGAVLHAQAYSLRGVFVLLSLTVDPKQPTTHLFEINSQKALDSTLEPISTTEIRPAEAKKGKLVTLSVDVVSGTVSFVCN